MNNQNDSYIYSEGKNYPQRGKVKVDPRTGNLSFRYVLGGVKGDILRGPSFSLILSYNSTDRTNAFRLGTGWGFNLTRYDTDTNRLILNNGSSYKVLTQPDGSLALRYSKLKNILVKKSSLPGILLEVWYKNGNKEYINTFGDLAFMAAQSGEQLIFERHPESGMLEKVFSKSNPEKKISLKIIQDDWIIESFKADGKPFQSKLVLNNDLLKGIEPGIMHSDPFYFQYQTEGLLEQVVNPGGGIYAVEYVKLFVPTGGPVSHVHAVGRFRTDPGDGGIVLETKYCYGGIGKAQCKSPDYKNYLGYLSGLTYIPDQDNLFLRDINYTYTTEVHNHDKVVIRVFNKFHLLVSKQTYNSEGVKLRERVVFYPASGEEQFERLPENYQLPIRVCTHFLGRSGKKRTVETKSTFDPYGNMTQHIDAMGREKNYTYYTIGQPFAGGTTAAQPFVKYLAVSEQYGLGKKNVHLVKHDYKKLPGTTPDSEIIVKTQLLSSYNTVLLDSQTFSYIENPSDKYYGYVSAIVKKSDKKTNRLLRTYKSIDPNTIQIRDTLSPDEYYDRQLSVHQVPQAQTRLEDAAGSVQKAVYDAWGRVSKQSNAQGASQIMREYLYHQTSKQHATETFFSNGHKKKVAYDGLKRKVSDFNYKEGQYIKTAQYTYDANNRLVSKKTFNKRPSGETYTLVTRFEYDIFGRLIRKVNPSGVSTITQYDDVGHSKLSYKESANAKLLAKTARFMNDEGKVIKIIKYNAKDEPYAVLEKTYEGFGRVASKTRNGRKTTYEYQDETHSRTITNPDGVTITVLMDPLSKKKQQLHIKDQALGSLKYDQVGRTIATVSPEGYVMQKDFEKGLISKKTDALGNTCNPKYRKALLQKVDYVSADKKEKQTVSYQYDAYNQLTAVHYPLGKSSFIYNPDTSIASTLYSYNNRPDYRISYQYDLLKRPFLIEDTRGNKIEIVRDQFDRVISKKRNGESILNLTYDSFNRIIQLNRINGINSTYVYDEFSRKTQVIHKQGETLLEQYTISYNQDSQITQLITKKSIYKNDRIEQFQYDALNRLVYYKRVYGTENLESYYQYDAYNNLVAVSTQNGITKKIIEKVDYAYDKTNPFKLLAVSIDSGVSDSSKIDLKYNKNGQIIQEIHTDKKGEHKLYFLYNTKGQLMKISDGKGSSLLHYDDIGRIIRKEFDKQECKDLYYRQQHPFVELHGEAVITHIGKKQILSFSKDGVRHRLYSPTGNVSACTAEKEKKWSYFNYTPFGEQQVESGSAEELGFQGNALEPLSGQIIFGNGQRLYSPKLRRFSAFDSLSPFGKGGINGYAYVLNNPVNYADPTGHFGLLQVLLNVLIFAVGELLDPVGGGIVAEEVELAAGGVQGAEGVAEGGAEGVAEGGAEGGVAQGQAAENIASQAETQPTAISIDSASQNHSDDLQGAVGGGDQPTAGSESRIPARFSDFRNTTDTNILAEIDKQVYWENRIADEERIDQGFTFEPLSREDAFYVQLENNPERVQVFDRTSLRRWVEENPERQNPITRGPLTDTERRLLEAPPDTDPIDEDHFDAFSTMAQDLISRGLDRDPVFEDTIARYRRYYAVFENPTYNADSDSDLEF